MYFLGTFDYAMDERGRLPLPPRYRDAFREGIVLSQGSPDRCLRLYTPKGFNEHAALVTSVPALHRRGRVMRRGVFGGSFHAELDGQNRVLIPGPLRQYAGLSAKVRLVGAGEFFEVWATESYDEELARVEQELESTFESFEPRGR